MLRLPITQRALGLGLAAGLLLTACGDDGSSEAEATTSLADTTTTAEATTTTAALTFDEASDRYEACLADNGSGVEEIPPNQSLDDLAERDPDDTALLEMGVDPGFVAAHVVCWPPFREAMDNGATPPTSQDTTTTTVDPKKAQQMHAAVACLNDRGWDFLEPGVETGPLTMAPRDPEFDWDDEAFLADQYDCQRLQGMMG